MQKDSARLFGTTVVIVTALIAGAYLLDRANKTGRPLPPEQATWTELTPSQRHPGQREARDPGSMGNLTSETQDIPAQTSAEGIITCQHPEHGTVYTNAASCDEVDYDSRLTPAEPFEPEENPERFKDE